MKKLKDKLVHMLGGFTEEDVRIRTRPVRCAVSRFSIRTLKVHQVIRPEVLAIYPEYMDSARKDIAFQLAEKMIEENLIEFSSKQESESDMIRVTALAKIVVPTEVSE